MFIRSWLLTVCGDFPQIGGQVSMRRMSLAAVSLLNQVRTVVAFLLVIMIALHPYVVRALPLPNARRSDERKSELMSLAFLLCRLLIAWIEPLRDLCCGLMHRGRD